MEGNDNLADLLGEVLTNIDMLQKAVAEVGQVKASLKTKASDVKSQIRDSISRHLEALRNRETWLLGQVEVVQHIKEDVLRQQQAELNKALGRLQSTCSLLEQSGSALDTTSLEYQVRESLATVGGLNLAPEETNVINFVARNFELQESIHKLGVVVSDNPLVDKQLVSSCEMLKLNSGRKVSFFTPSGSCEDWLMKKEAGSTVKDVPKNPAAVFNVQDWLLPKATPAASTTESSAMSMPQQSIEHWLTKSLSQRAAMKTEDEEGDDSKEASAIVKNKTAEIQTWLLQCRKTSEVPSVSSVNLFDYYRVVKMSDSGQWLKKSGIAKEELSTNLIGETYHQIAASGCGEWLLKRESPATPSSKFSRSISTQSCSECSCGLASICSETDAQEKSVEFDDTSSELSDWLAVEKDVETSSGVTASSDLMSSKVPDNDRWLLKQSCESSYLTNDYTGIKRYKESLAAQSNQQWLHRQDSDMLDNKEAEEEAGSGMKSYIDSLPVDYNHWLSNRPSDSSICKWLARSSSERCKDCPRMCTKGLFKVFDQVASSKDGWLMSQELY